MIYLNTDLDVESTENISELVKFLKDKGIRPLHFDETIPDEVLEKVIFETDETQHTEPEANIAEMLAAIESLPFSLRSVWDRCTLKEFNVGYDCSKKWAFYQSFSAALLRRIVTAGATLGFTYYPEEEGPPPLFDEVPTEPVQKRGGLTTENYIDSDRYFLNSIAIALIVIIFMTFAVILGDKIVLLYSL